MSNFMGQFNAQSQALSTQLLLQANSLFWILATISLVWTMSMHLLRRSDISEVLAELVRFVVFTGLFFWFLQSASDTSAGDGFVSDIVKSFSQMAVTAASSAGASSPDLGKMGATADSLIQIGLTLFNKIVDNTTVVGTSELDNASMLILGFVVLVALALTGIHVVIVTMSFWALAYAGIFLLGFGGSRWTSSVAINYYKHVFGVAVAYLATILLLAIGVPFLQDYNAGLDSANKIKGLAVMVVVSLLLLMLVARIPRLLYSVVATSRLKDVVRPLLTWP
jgi:P-type conjugative transfer protein TrbL